MIRTLSLLLTFFVFSCNSKTLTNKALEEKEVKLVVQITSDYCGGANPPEQLLKNLKTPKPFRNSELILKSSDVDFQEVLKTDELGEIEKSLPIGKYQIFFPEKLNSSPMQKAISKEYCIEWKETPDASIEVTSEKTTFQLKLHKSCNPCEMPRP